MLQPLSESFYWSVGPRLHRTSNALLLFQSWRKIIWLLDKCFVRGNLLAEYSLFKQEMAESNPKSLSSLGIYCLKYLP